MPTLTISILYSLGHHSYRNQITKIKVSQIGGKEVKLSLFGGHDTIGLAKNFLQFVKQK